MSVDNPFYHRGAIRRAEEFYGREVETSQILGLLRNGQSVSLVGPRRIGKSSLLLHICRPLTRTDKGLSTDDMIFALLDCQELGGSPPEEVYEALFTSVSDSANMEIGELELVDPPGTYRALDRILSAIHRRGISVVLLLDEFELLAANDQLTPYFFARLRGLTTKYGLAYVTASQRPLFAITADEKILSSPFFNIFATLSLGLFTEVNARGLLEERLERTGISFSDDLNDYLLSFVGRHPCLLHIAGYHAFQAHANNANMLEDDTRRLVESSIEVEIDSHLSYQWQNLTQEERYCLAITDGPTETIRQLEQQCLIEYFGDQPQYTSEVLHRFVRRQLVEGLIQAGPFVIDQQRHRVHIGGSEMPLTSSQFDLLVRLGEQSGHVVPGEELEIAVWGNALVNDPDRLKTLIKRLRRAIDPYSGWIISERGVGYALRDPSD
jgi:hypothetical protein